LKIPAEANHASEDGVPEQVPEFHSEADAQDWIINKSDAGSRLGAHVIMADKCPRAQAIEPALVAATA
jgi:hypothetical protein